MKIVYVTFDALRSQLTYVAEQARTQGTVIAVTRYGRPYIQLSALTDDDLAAMAEHTPPKTSSA